MITFPAQYNGTDLLETSHRKRNLSFLDKKIQALSFLHSMDMISCSNAGSQLLIKNTHENHKITLIGKIKALKPASPRSIYSLLPVQKLFCHEHPQDGNYGPKVSIFIII